MAYSSTEPSTQSRQTEFQPPLETLVRTISRCSGYLVLALAAAGLFLLLF